MSRKLTLYLFSVIIKLVTIQNEAGMNVQFEPKGSGIGIEQGSQVTFGAGKTTTYEAVSTRSGGGY